MSQTLQPSERGKPRAPNAMSCAAAAALCLVVTPGLTQQRVPMGNGGTPRAPTGIACRRSARGRRVSHGRGARHSRRRAIPRPVAPWSLAFLPSGDMLGTERGGQFRIVRGGTLDRSRSRAFRRAGSRLHRGLFDVALHPPLADQSLRLSELQQTCGAEPHTVWASRVALRRPRADRRARHLRDDGLEQRLAARVRPGRMLYVWTFGSARHGMAAQDPMSLAGEVLRLTTTARADRQSALGKAGYKPEIYTLGHRSTLVSPGIPERARSGRTRTARTAATRSTC